jgi:hypothetical protein
VVGIGGNLQQRPGTGPEEKIVNNLLVLQSQPGEFMRYGKDHVNVLHRQQLCATFGEPLFTSVGLALRTVPGTARIERDGLMTALAAPVQVATERCRAAVLDGKQYADVQPRQPGPVLFDKTLAICANDVSHLERWRLHFLCNLRERFT